VCLPGNTRAGTATGGEEEVRVHRPDRERLGAAKKVALEKPFGVVRLRERVGVGNDGSRSRHVFPEMDACSPRHGKDPVDWSMIPSRLLDRRGVDQSTR
jgi:hypothetical protein